MTAPTLDQVDQDTAPDADLSAMVDAMRMAQRLDPADLRAIVDGTARRVARKMGASTYADAAQADALNRAIRAALDGLPIGAAVAVASRDAIADASRRAAAQSLDSLDSADATGATLADRIDNGHGATGRLSAYDAQRGVWRGVARVPHPEDCLRPAEMPAPEQIASMARDAMTDAARAALDATVAVNVAAQEQQRHLVADLAAYVSRATVDAADASRASRTGRASLILAERKTARTALDNAKRQDNPHRPRTGEVTAALDLPTTGRNRATVAALQAAAWTAYATHRAAIVAAALARHSADLTADADRARRNAHAAAMVTSGWTRGAQPAEQIAARIGRARLITRRTRRAASAAMARASATAATWSRSALHTPTAPTGRQRGACIAYSADNGAAQPTDRPRVSLTHWDPWRLLSWRVGTDPKTSRAANQQPAPTAHRPQAQPITPGRARIPAQPGVPVIPRHTCDSPSTCRTCARAHAHHLSLARARADLAAVHAAGFPADALDPAHVITWQPSTGRSRADLPA